MQQPLTLFSVGHTLLFVTNILQSFDIISQICLLVNETAAISGNRIPANALSLYIRCEVRVPPLQLCRGILDFTVVSLPVSDMPAETYRSAGSQNFLRSYSDNNTD